VFRIGSDALLTAQAIMDLAVRPALSLSGLPLSAVTLVESRSHASGWALFSDRRVSLAIARGSGKAVAQLGAVAQQHGIPASLHGTGGAWMIVGESANSGWFDQVVLNSMDRKVCNTLNVCCSFSEEFTSDTSRKH
jgi:glutamate-5-semialdehyde dehydrogenase